jgi:hypothetical protein
MARKVKDTPVLTGKDARRFERAIKANEKNPVSLPELARIKAALRRFTVVTLPCRA